MVPLTTTAATVPCAARVGLADGRTLEAVLYLLTDPGRSGGHLSVEEVVDGPRLFVPMRLEGNGALVARDAIRTIVLEADGPGVTGQFDAGGSLDVVTLRLDSGETISGVLRALSREGAARMSDFFNGPGKFLTIDLGDKVVLVSKRHVVSATF